MQSVTWQPEEEEEPHVSKSWHRFRAPGNECNKMPKYWWVPKTGDTYLDDQWFWETDQSGDWILVDAAFCTETHSARKRFKYYWFNPTLCEIFEIRGNTGINIPLKSWHNFQDSEHSTYYWTAAINGPLK